jgi:hypothetical protein
VKYKKEEKRALVIQGLRNVRKCGISVQKQKVKKSINHPALRGGAFKRIRNICTLLVTLNSFQGLIYFLDSEPSSE